MALIHSLLAKVALMSKVRHTDKTYDAWLDALDALADQHNVPRLTRSADNAIHSSQAVPKLIFSGVPEKEVLAVLMMLVGD